MTALTAARSIAVPTRRDETALLAFGKTLRNTLKDGSEGEVFALDLRGARLRASELALMLEEPIRSIVGRSAHSKKGPPRTYLVGDDPGGANLWDADAALRKLTADSEKKATLVMPWRCSKAKTVLVGRVDQTVGVAYEFVLRSRAGATSRGFVEERGGDLTMQAASNQLSRLVSLGLIHPVRRDPNPRGGGHWVYMAVR